MDSLFHCVKGLLARQIPFEFSYMWNLMNKKQNSNRSIDTDNRLTAVRGEVGCEAG